MLYFFAWNHQKNNLFFTSWAIFWNISRICFSFFSMRSIIIICYITFLNFFLIILFWWKTYSFTVICIYKFLLFFLDLFLFLQNLTRLLQGIKNICHLFYWWDLLLFFLFSNRRQTHYLLKILNYFDIYNFIFFTINHGF